METTTRSDYSALDEIVRIISCIRQEDDPSPADYEWAISMIESKLTLTGRRLS